MFLFNFFIIVVGTLFKYKMKIILKKAKDLKTVIFSDKGMFLHLQIESTFLIFSTTSRKFFSKYIWWLYVKFTPRILKCLLSKFMFPVPKSAVWTPFLTPIPAILHLLLFTFKPEYFEKNSNVLKIHFAELSFLIKNVVSSLCQHKTSIGTLNPKYLTLQCWGYFLSLWTKLP